LANGFGDFAAYPIGFEAVNFELEVREGGPDGGEDSGLEPCPEEMELNVFWARGVLENGEDRGHGASDVIGVQGHGNVDYLFVA